MKKSTLLAAVVLTVATSGAFDCGQALARSGGIQLPVEILPLPSVVSRVSPNQGVVDLDGSSTTGSPLGAGDINITFTSAPEKNIDIEPGQYIKMYVDGESEPSELLPVEKANVDYMGLPAGGFHFARKYVTKGTYHIEIPAGVWIVNGQETPAFALNYEITNDYFISPAAGVVDEITEFEIIFPSSFETTVDTSKISFYKERTDENIAITVETVPPSIEGEEQNTFIIRPAEPVKDPYTYVLQMDKGAFKQKWYGPDYSKTEGVRDISSDAQVLRFIIPDVAIPDIVPAADSEVTYFTNFVLTAKEEGNFSLIPNDKVGNYLYPASEDWEVDTAPYARVTAFITDDEVAGDQRSIVLSFFDAKQADGTIDENYKLVPPPGNYVLQLGEGAFSEFQAGGAPLLAAPYSFRYTVVADPTITEILPASNTELSKLEEVEIRYPNAQYVEENPECAQAITILDEAGLPVEVEVAVAGGGVAPNVEGDEEYTGAKVVLSITPALVEKGKYTLVLPQGFFTCNGKYASLEEQAVYSIDGTLGLVSIEGDSDTVTVFTPTGICVLRNAAPDALSTLPAGIYVVNGRKLVVR